MIPETRGLEAVFTNRTLHLDWQCVPNRWVVDWPTGVYEAHVSHLKRKPWQLRCCQGWWDELCRVHESFMCCRSLRLTRRTASIILFAVELKKPWEMYIFLPRFSFARKNDFHVHRNHWRWDMCVRKEEDKQECSGCISVYAVIHSSSPMMSENTWHLRTQNQRRHHSRSSEE